MIARYHHEPIGFKMITVPPGSSLQPKDLCDELGGDVFSRVVARQVRRELLPVQQRGSHVPSITVAVCTKDRPTSLARCLESLLHSWTRYGAPNNVEMLVVDNAPRDGRTRAVAEMYDQVRYVSEPTPGLNVARNRAVAAARTDIVGFIDDDVAVDSHWLDALCTTWRDYPRAGAVSGQVLPLKLDTQARILFEQAGGFRRGFETLVFSIDRIDPNRLYPCNTGDFGVGCNMSFRRDLLLQLGGFDVALDTGPPLPGGGDHDMLYRVVRSGQPLVYAPACVAFHEHRATMQQLRRQYWTWGESTLAFANKSLRSDEEMRPRWRRLILFWFLRQIVCIIKSLCGRGVLPPTACASELAGCVVGYCGAYRRSRRRMDRLMEEHAP